jgi:hypothetical protein
MFVGIADGLLTPVNKKWHTLKPKDKSLLKDKRVMDWYYEVNEVLFDYRYLHLESEYDLFCFFCFFFPYPVLVLQVCQPHSHIEVVLLD